MGVLGRKSSEEFQDQAEQSHVSNSISDIPASGVCDDLDVQSGESAHLSLQSVFRQLCCNARCPFQCRCWSTIFKFRKFGDVG
jgi:hypothetical protein